MHLFTIIRNLAQKALLTSIFLTRESRGNPYERLDNMHNSAQTVIQAQAGTQDPEAVSWQC